MEKAEIRKLVSYWKDLSDYDLTTAKHMFATRQYPYCLFMCHLSVEKILKSLIVKHTNNHAPFTHNLVELAQGTAIAFSKEQQILLADLSEFNIEARYPKWQKEFYKTCTKKYTEDYYVRSKELQIWLKKHI